MPAKSETGILWIEELRKDDIPLVGGKNANLGELHGAIGAPVKYLPNQAVSDR